MQNNLCRLTALFAAVFLTVSCGILSPQKADKAVTLPADYAGKTVQTVRDDRWWQEFEDKKLNSLIEDALGNNFSIKSAYYRLKQAEAAAVKAGAGRFFEVSANAGRSLKRTKSEGRSAVDTYQWNAGLSASYEIDLWGRVSVGFPTRECVNTP